MDTRDTNHGNIDGIQDIGAKKSNWGYGIPAFPNGALHFHWFLWVIPWPSFHPVKIWSPEKTTEKLQNFDIFLFFRLSVLTFRTYWPVETFHHSFQSQCVDIDELDPSNYRPISLLSIFNRIFGKLIYNRSKSFLDKHHTLYHHQHGFGKNASHSMHSLTLSTESSAILMEVILV